MRVKELGFVAEAQPQSGASNRAPALLGRKADF